MLYVQSFVTLSQAMRQESIEPPPPGGSCPEQRLFQAVILRAVIDYHQGNGFAQGYAARFLNSTALEVCCELADLPQGAPDKIRQWVPPDPPRPRVRQPSRYLEHNGERLPLSEWARRTGVPGPSITSRLACGWSVAEALGFEPRESRRGKVRPQKSRKTQVQPA